MPVPNVITLEEHFWTPSWLVRGGGSRARWSA